MNRGYRYPDLNDQITALAVEQREPAPGLWNESAERGLNLLDRKLRTILPPRETLNGLDAGCGQGRLIPWAAKFAASITAVDADFDRLRKARMQKCPTDTMLRFDCKTITEIDGGPYDFIVCSHVLQHVPTTMVTGILEHLSDIASSKAVMVLAFSQAAIGEESFGLSYLDSGRACSNLIDRTRFDEIASDRHHTGSVPFRQIDPEILAVEARNAGWSLCWKWLYHITNDFGYLCDQDREEAINLSPDLERRSTGDVYTLWCKSSSF